MTKPIRTAFLEQANQKLNSGHFLVLSPFAAAENFEKLEEDLKVFADDITAVLEIIRDGLKMESAEQVRGETWALEREVGRLSATDRAYVTRLGSSPEERLMNAFKEDVAKAQQDLHDLDDAIRLGTVTDKMKQDIENNFLHLLDMVQGIPDWYRNTPAAMMAEYNFTFRPDTLEA